MSTDEKNKTRPVFAIYNGTAAGSSSFIDTAGYESAYLYTVGTTGSATALLYANSGSAVWTGTDLSRDLILLGSHTAGGTGIPAKTSIAGLTEQAIIAHATINGTYDTSYILFD